MKIVKKKSFFFLTNVENNLLFLFDPLLLQVTSQTVLAKNHKQYHMHCTLYIHWLCTWTLHTLIIYPTKFYVEDS